MEAANEALGTLISGRQRKDGKDWKTAYEYMQVYLQVSWGSLPLLLRSYRERTQLKWVCGAALGPGQQDRRAQHYSCGRHQGQGERWLAAKIAEC